MEILDDFLTASDLLTVQPANSGKKKKKKKKRKNTEITQETEEPAVENTHEDKETEANLSLQNKTGPNGLLGKSEESDKPKKKKKKHKIEEIETAELVPDEQHLEAQQFPRESRESAEDSGPIKKKKKKKHIDESVTQAEDPVIASISEEIITEKKPKKKKKKDRDKVSIENEVLQANVEETSEVLPKKKKKREHKSSIEPSEQDNGAEFYEAELSDQSRKKKHKKEKIKEVTTEKPESNKQDQRLDVSQTIREMLKKETEKLHLQKTGSDQNCGEKVTKKKKKEREDLHLRKNSVDEDCEENSTEGKKKVKSKKVELITKSFEEMGFEKSSAIQHFLEKQKEKLRLKKSSEKRKREDSDTEEIKDPKAIRQDEEVLDIMKQKSKSKKKKKISENDENLIESEVKSKNKKHKSEKEDNVNEEDIENLSEWQSDDHYSVKTKKKKHKSKKEDNVNEEDIENLSKWQSDDHYSVKTKKKKHKSKKEDNVNEEDIENLSEWQSDDHYSVETKKKKHKSKKHSDQEENEDETVEPRWEPRREKKDSPISEDLESVWSYFKHNENTDTEQNVSNKKKKKRHRDYDLWGVGNGNLSESTDDSDNFTKQKRRKSSENEEEEELFVSKNKQTGPEFDDFSEEQSSDSERNVSNETQMSARKLSLLNRILQERKRKLQFKDERAKPASRRKSIVRQDEDEDEMDVDIDKLVEESEEKHSISLERLTKIKKLKISLPWPIPPLHNIENKIRKLSRNMIEKAKEDFDIKVNTEKFSQEENEIMRSNFRNFCEVHNLDEDPSIFVELKEKKYDFFDTENGKDFLRFMAHGLNDRLLVSVYHQFHKLFAKPAIGKQKQKQQRQRFTEREDKIIKEYIAKHGLAGSFAKLTKILNRSEASLYQRWKMKLKDQGAKKEWGKKEMERFVNSLLKISTIKNLEDLENQEISSEEWIQLSEKLHIPFSELKDVWENKIYPYFFRKTSTNYRMKMGLLKRLYRSESEKIENVNWQEIAVDFSGYTPRKLKNLFKHFIKYYKVPDDLRSNLPETIKYLVKKLGKPKK